MVTEMRAARPSTGWIFLAVAVVCAYLFTPTVEQVKPQSAAVTDLSGWLASRVSKMDESDPYRSPSYEERRAAVTALRDHLNWSQTKSDLRNSQDAKEAAKRVGIQATTGADKATGRPYSMLASETDTERAWGAVIVDRSEPLKQVIEVPHPKDDLQTPEAGLQLFRKVPGSALVIAGSDRHAGKNADVGKEIESMFHAYAGVLAQRAPKEVQLHGYADDSVPGVDAVPSPGASTTTSKHAAVAKSLRYRKFDVCSGWQQYCGDLRGRKNVQSRAAELRGGRFLHLELSRAARSTESGRAKVVESIRRSW